MVQTVWFFLCSSVTHRLPAMKRNPNLVNLSSEHHDGLVVALRIKKAVAKLDDLSPVLIYTLHVWPTLKHHFAQEEDNFFLFPKIKRSHVLVNRMLDEHLQFEQLIQKLSSDSSQLKDDLLIFSELLKNHIRFEERELFPYIEDILSQDELQQIGAQLAQSHQPLCVNWGVNFWD